MHSFIIKVLCCNIFETSMRQLENCVAPPRILFFFWRGGDGSSVADQNCLSLSPSVCLSPSVYLSLSLSFSVSACLFLIYHEGICCFYLWIYGVNTTGSSFVSSSNRTWS